jgi:hypothetical protein
MGSMAPRPIPPNPWGEQSRDKPTPEMAATSVPPPLPPKAGTDYERKYHTLMGWLRDSQLPHGACNRPFACTACLASKSIATELANYKGRTVRPC